MSRSASEPLRPLTEEETKELQRVSRASSESASAISERSRFWQSLRGKA